MKNSFILISGSSNSKLALDVGKILNQQVYFPVTRFANGEARVQIEPDIRGRDVFIIQPTCPPHTDSSIIELILIIDAVKRSSVNEITVVIPHYAYARQDRKDQPRVPISSSAIAQAITSVGADRIVTLDIHSDQQQGFVQIPWDNLYSSFVLIPAIKKLKLKNLVVTSPDKGGILMASAYAKRLGFPNLAFVYKERDINVANKSQALGMIGEVKDKPVLLIDDMIDTGGSLCNAASLLKEKGATTIIAAASHGLFSDPALERIRKSPIDTVITTDSIPHRKEVLAEKKIKIVSVAPLLSQAIELIHKGESISEDLII